MRHCGQGGAVAAKHLVEGMLEATDPLKQLRWNADVAETLALERTETDPVGVAQLADGDRLAGCGKLLDELGEPLGRQKPDVEHAEQLAFEQLKLVCDR